MDITYNQVLADELVEDAKSKLVVARQYDYDQLEEQDDGLDDNKLENPDDFNKFHGDRNKPEHVITPDKAAPNTNKDIRVTVVNIDGRFRNAILPTQPTTVSTPFGNGYTLITTIPGNPGTLSSNFIVRTSRQYVNVSEVTVTSIEFPNNFYTFSSSRNNVSFTLEYTDSTQTIVQTIVTIPDGNYINIVNPTTNTGFLPIPPNATQSYIEENDVTTLVGAIQQVIDDEEAQDAEFLAMNFTIIYSLTQHNIQISAAQGRPFTLTFPTTDNNCYGNGIGYNLGFSNTSITSVDTITNKFGVKPTLGTPDSHSIIGDVFPDVIQDRYVYLIVNDWNLVEHQTINQTYFSAFAKIPLTAPKTAIYNDSATVNTISKTYKFHQPTNINLISIKLVDSYNQVIDMKDSSISMTLEVTEVTNSAEYQRLLQL